MRLLDACDLGFTIAIVVALILVSLLDVLWACEIRVSSRKLELARWFRPTGKEHIDPVVPLGDATITALLSRHPVVELRWNGESGEEKLILKHVAFELCHRICRVAKKARHE